MEIKSAQGAGALPKPVRGLIFDLDGTLADTEGLYQRFWLEAANSLGYPMQRRHTLMIRSMAASVAGPLMRREVCPDFDYEAVRDRRRGIMAEWIDAHGVQPKPGAPEILRYAAEHGIPAALATTTPQERVHRVLGLLGLEGMFAAIVSGDMIEHGPYIYGEFSDDIYEAVERLQWDGIAKYVSPNGRVVLTDYGRKYLHEFIKGGAFEDEGAIV